MITSKHTVREQNEALILKAIIDHHEISRAELSQITSMNKASVSEITKSLIHNALIEETRIGDSSTLGGRKPIMLTLNQNAGYAITIDIGSHYVEALMTNISGVIVDRYQLKDIAISSLNVIDQIQIVVTQFQRILPDSPHGIIGMTLAIHGLVNQDDIQFTPAYDLDTIPLKNQVEPLFDFPIYILNEANLAGLGEYTFGTNSENLVTISIHTGIGAGIVRNGKLYTGANGKSGEIGHMTLFPGGKQCPCGNHGCLELYGSHEALYESVRKTLNVDSVNSDIIAALYNAHPDKMAPILEEYTKIIAICINDTVLFSDPDVIIINSSVYRKVPELIEWTISKIESRFTKNIIIQNSAMDGDAILFGGVAFAAQQFLNIQGLKFIQR